MCPHDVNLSPFPREGDHLVQREQDGGSGEIEDKVGFLYDVLAPMEDDQDVEGIIKLVGHPEGVKDVFTGRLGREDVDDAYD